MVNVTPLIKQGSQIIQSYAGGGFKVSGAAYDGPIIVTPSSTFQWDVKSMPFLRKQESSQSEGKVPAFAGKTEEETGNAESLKVEDFQALIDMKAELDVALLGTGAKIQFLPPDLKQALKEQGLHIEVMDTGAACRTYNVLMAEGRRVAAALVPYEAGTQ